MHVDLVIHMSMSHPHNLENVKYNNYFNANPYITSIDSRGNMDIHCHRPPSIVTKYNLCDKKKDCLTIQYIYSALYLIQNLTILY